MLVDVAGRAKEAAPTFGGEQVPDQPTVFAAGDRMRPGDVGRTLTVAELLRREFGSYVPIRVIGQGGMGLVLLAYDRRLDRRIALKVLAPTVNRHSVEEQLLVELCARLQQEARALAKLAHANVVTIFDVGVMDGQIFLAMEYIDGQTLRKWCQAAPRSVDAVLDVFLQAGEALAAAHCAGLVHRDFKPENVLVNHQGHAFVVDFGIALDSRAPPADVKRAAAGLPLRVTRIDERAPITDLTRVGWTVGTPRYMSPEQSKGQACGPPTDVYAYFLTLLEMLTDRHPFESGKQGNYAQPMAAPTLQEAMARRVPVWLQPALRRGLRAAPGDRYRDMSEAVADLRDLWQSARARKRWRRLVVAWSFLIGVVALAAWSSHALLAANQRVANPCEHPEQSWRGIWDEARQEALRVVFADTGLAFVGETWSRVVTHVDSYKEQWLTIYGQRCRDPALARQSLAFDQHMHCLIEARRRVDSLIKALVQAEDRLAAATAAMPALHELPRLSECDGEGAALAAWQVPVSRDLQPKFTTLTEAIALARGQFEAGQYVLAQHSVDALRLSLQPIDDPLIMGLLAELDVLDGSIRVQLGDPLAAADLYARARLHGRAGNRPTIVAKAALEAAFVQGYLRSEREVGFELLAEVRPLLHALGDPPEFLLLWHNNLGLLHWVDQHNASARAAFETALVAARRGFGELSPQVALVLGNLVLVEASEHRLQAAVDIATLTLATYEAALGRGHPANATAASNLGSLMRDLGNYAQAALLGEQATTTCLNAANRMPLACAFHQTEWALSQQSAGQASAAAATLAALAAQQAAQGRRGHPSISWAVSDAAMTALTQGQAQVAFTFAELGVHHIDHEPNVLPEMRAKALRTLADTELELGRLEQAYRHAVEANDLMQQAGPEVDYHRPAVLRTLALVEHALGKSALAKQRAEAAFAAAKLIYSTPDNPNLTPYLALVDRLHRTHQAANRR